MAVKTLLKAVYQEVHSRLPEPLGDRLSDLAFGMTGKPYVVDAIAGKRIPRLDRGSVTFSLDFEMAWAWQYARTQHKQCVEIGLRERSQVPEILRAFEAFQIGATWATVGHLFLESCSRDGHGIAHPELPHVQHFQSRFWSFTDGDWYQFDPGTDVRRSPAWYAPDLVERILSAHAGHEIACHGFSHVGLGQSTPPAIVAAELDACQDAAKRFDLHLGTLVYPGNEAGNFDVIAEKGFTSVRWYPVSWAEIALPVRRDDGLWALQGSVCLEAPSDASNLVRKVSLLKRYIDRAVETGLNAHLWFHPSLRPGQIGGVLEPILRYCADLREKGDLEIHTMDRLVQQVRRTPPLETIP
jgi:hypothetical protein